MTEMISMHRDWTIDVTPEPLAIGYSARAWMQREAAEGEANGDNFTFSDLGDYATQGEAASRAAGWAVRWLNEND
jgi:hypothetical protein